MASGSPAAAAGELDRGVLEPLPLAGADLLAGQRLAVLGVEVLRAEVVEGDFVGAAAAVVRVPPPGRVKACFPPPCRNLIFPCALLTPGRRLWQFLALHRSKYLVGSAVEISAA